MQPIDFRFYWLSFSEIEPWTCYSPLHLINQPVSNISYFIDFPNLFHDKPSFILPTVFEKQNKILLTDLLFPEFRIYRLIDLNFLDFYELWQFHIID